MFRIKSIIYNILGSILLFGPFALSFYIISNIFSSDHANVFAMCCMSFITLIITGFITFGLFYIGNDSIFGDGHISGLVYRKLLLSLNRVKIVYHSDYGKFVCISDIDSDYIMIYNQRYFMLENIGSVRVSNNLDSITNEIKSIIESEMMSREHSEKKRNTKSDVLKKWDGYLDTVGKRDDKINKILKR
jgi:hypothetical protein